MDLDVKDISGNIVCLIKKRGYAIFSFLFLSGMILFFLFRGNLLTEDAPVTGAHNKPAIDFFEPSCPTHFPLSERLKLQVEFWKKIFTEYTSKQVVIHDRRHVNIIYTVIDLTQKQLYSRNAREKTIRTAEKKYKRMLRRLKPARRVLYESILFMK